MDNRPDILKFGPQHSCVHPEPQRYLHVVCSSSKGISSPIWEKANGGGAKRIVPFWGGASKTSFGGLRKWDWSGLCPFPLSKCQGVDGAGTVS